MRVVAEKTGNCVKRIFNDVLERVPGIGIQNTVNNMRQERRGHIAQRMAVSNRRELCSLIIDLPDFSVFQHPDGCDAHHTAAALAVVDFVGDKAVSCLFLISALVKRGQAGDSGRSARKHAALSHQAVRKKLFSRPFKGRLLRI